MALTERFRLDLTCVICRELFKEPKTLPCLHTFCEECLAREIENRPLDIGNGDTREQFPCPLCREVMPCGDVAQVRTNPTFKNMVNHLTLKDKVTSTEGHAKCGGCVEKPDAEAICKSCNKPLCEYCKDAHARMEDTATHEVILLSEVRRRREASSMTTGPSTAGGSSHAQGGVAVSAHAAITHPSASDVEGGETEASGFEGIKQIPWKCKHHPGEKVEVYCEDCDKVVCFRCAVLKHRTDDGQMHKHKSASEVVDFYSTKVTDVVQQVEDIETRFKEAIGTLNKFQSSLDEAEKCEKEKIQKQCRKLQKQLEEQEKALLEKVEEIARRKRARLEDQRKELQDIVDNRLHASAKIAKGVCEVGIPVEVLAMWSQLHGRLTKVRDDYDGYRLQPVDNDIVQFERNKESEQKILESNAIGEVTSDSHPQSFTVDAVEDQHFIQGKRQELTVTCRDIVGTKLPCHLHAVRAELRQVVGDGGGGGGRGGETQSEAVACEVVNNQDGTYKVTLQPQAYGPHGLSITVNKCDQEIPIKGSPFCFRVAPPHCTVDKPLHAINKDQVGPEGMNPWGIAVTNDQTLVVSDIKNDRILIFDNERRFVRAVGSEGQGEVEFKSPRGVAISIAGNFIVAEKDNHRLQEVTLDSSFVRFFGENDVGKSSGGQGKFASPTGVAVNQHGVVFATDSLNQRIQYFQPDGTYLGVIGKWGRGPNAFNDPYGICVCNQLQGFGEEGHETLFVTSREGHQVQRLEKQQDDQYSCVKIFDERTHRVQKPVGVAVDPKSGYVFVVELAKHCLSIFTKDGSLVYSFGRQGSGEGQFENPVSVAVVNDSCVAVTDCGNSRILIFQVFCV